MEIKCRCCLASKQGVYHSLLSVLPNFGENCSSLLEILRLVTSSQVTYTDDLPTEICESCLANLKTSFEFIVLFKNAQTFLQNGLHLNPVEDEESHEDIEEAIIITPEECEDIFDESIQEERIIIVNEDEENVERNFEQIFGDEYYSVDDGEVGEDSESNTPKSQMESSENQNELEPVTNDMEEESIIKQGFLNEEEINIEGNHEEKVLQRRIKAVTAMAEAKELQENYTGVGVRIVDVTNLTEKLICRKCQALLSLKVVEDFHKKIFIHMYRKEYMLILYEVDNEELVEIEKNREKNKSNITIMTIEDVLKVDRRKSSEKKVILSAEDVVNAQKKSRLKQELIGAFICDVCKRIFNTRRNLMLHKYRLHNPDWKDKFKCSQCGIQCQTLSKLRHHMLKHSNQRFECHLCCKAYVVKQHLNVHIQSKHLNTFPNKYLCPLCGKSFKSGSALTYHLRIHNNQRNYMCRFCGFKSLTMSAMKRHERVHTGERPYECRYCDKNFAGSAERQKHENIHNGIMPYKCQYCDKKFVQPYNMKVHMLNHNGSHACEICDVLNISHTFIDEEVLKFHYQRVHKMKIGIKEKPDEETE